MKKKTLLVGACVVGIGTLLTFLLPGCFKDNCSKSYTYFVPVYKTTAQVRAEMKSNPAKNVELPGKIYLYGKYIFLNDLNKGIHIYDNSNPSSPQNVAFIDIPGNVDMAVKGNILYADSYSDLVTIDITNPLDAKALTFTENIFPVYGYYNSYDPVSGSNIKSVVVDWIKRDTTIDIDCGKNKNLILYFDGVTLNSYTASQGTVTSPAGIGGSTARFALAKDHLYTVHQSSLKAFNLSSPKQPSFEKTIDVQRTVETIFPFQNKLFIGSTSGMFIYNIDNAANPVQEGQFEHVRSCDPVIADSKFAYVTLRSGNTCAGYTNQLEVLNIENLKNPVLLKTHLMTNPRGLSKDGDLLFICDGPDGLRVYKTADGVNIESQQTISGIETYDVIANNKVALVVAKDGLYQYDYSNPSNLKLLSKISVK
ncbi:LVIVD repeat-containing protein [Pinibacter aurantiacus]|uniref:LVIVD repeat-containing protein n=1 Tax=Pinibacter aurantiacus TaxID=2851599 RepID=A0A9E2S604_9BACT|nr:hypothetical protein [Pinibacter aurantiacus]MBV4356262.1 hypothetical protein [Pinibacter aurantiacus]